MIFADDENIGAALDRIDSMVVHTGDRLVKVFERRDMEMEACIALILLFPERQIEIAVRCEDDSLHICSGTTIHIQSINSCRDVSLMIPWQQAVGKSLSNFCVMINNRGYVEGVQIEFSNSIYEDPIFAQITGVGSSLHMRHVSEANTLQQGQGTQLFD